MCVWVCRWVGGCVGGWVGGWVGGCLTWEVFGLGWAAHATSAASLTTSWNDTSAPPSHPTGIVVGVERGKLK